MKLRNRLLLVFTCFLACDTSLASDDTDTVYTAAELSTSGIRHFGGNVPNGTQFEAGSIAKFVCALSIFEASRDGQLRLDDFVGDYVPELNTPSLGKITVQQVLANRSGLQDRLKTVLSEQPDYPARVADTQRAVTDLIAPMPAFAPGERFDYQIVNWLVAQRLLETVYDQTIEQTLRATVFRPAALSNTDIFSGNIDGSIPAVLRAKSRPIPQFLACGGGIKTTVTDLLLLAKYPFVTLEAEELGQFIAYTTVDQHYALGGRYKYLDVAGETHLASFQTGTNGSFYAKVVYLPALDRGIALMSNAGEAPVIELYEQWLHSLARLTTADDA